MPATHRAALGPGRGPLSSLRRWWWLPLLGALLGAALGLMAGSHSSYTSTALLRSRVAGVEAQAVAQGAQTALSTLETGDVFATAASTTGTSASDLRDRTRMAIVGDSSVLSVAVQAPTQDQAIREANAIADAGLKTYAARTDADLGSVRKRMVDLLDKGQLADLPAANPNDKVEPAARVAHGQAELSRQQAIGQALGEAQSTMVTSQGTLSMLERATTATVAKDVSKAVAAMSALGGLLLGLALALLLGARRSKIRGDQHLRTLYPEATVVAGDELMPLLDLDAPRYDRVAVVSDEPRLRERVAERLAGSPVQVVGAGGASSLVGRLARDPRTLVLVDVPRGTRVDDIDEVGRDAGEDTVLVSRG